MKITINGNVTPDTIESFLDKQKIKSEKIEAFCKKNKVDELSYKDSELEFEYKQNVEFATPKKKVETRGGGENGKD